MGPPVPEPSTPIRIGLLFLEGERLNDEPFLLELDPGRPWRIDLAGYAVETTALVRNIVLWRGGRY